MKNLSPKIRPLRPTRLALSALVLSLVASAMIGITIIILGDFSETEMRVLATAGTLAGYSILSLPSFFHMERARYTYLTLLAIPTSLAFLVMILLLIWSENILFWVTEGTFWKTLGSAGVIAFAANHSLLMLIVTPSKALISLFQWATVLIIATVGTLIVIAIWTEEMPMRLLAALIVLDVLGTISIPILARLFRIR